MFFTRHERTLNTDVGSLMLPPTRKKDRKGKKAIAEKCSYLGNEYKVQGTIK